MTASVTVSGLKKDLHHYQDLWKEVEQEEKRHPTPELIPLEAELRQTRCEHIATTIAALTAEIQKLERRQKP